MKQKLNCILLIDDDEATNYLNKMVVDKSGCTEKCIAVESGFDALEYLKSKEDGEYPQPDLIFLDINMPAMNGWEFLLEYEKLEACQQGHIVVVMLTTSLNPDDEEKANSLGYIEGFMSKPLTIPKLMSVVEKYFLSRM